MKAPHRLYLTEEQMPKQWYNVRADMKEQHDPIINPATMKPAQESDLYPVFCKKLAHQELDSETRYVDIPEEVQEMYKIYRPSPLIRAYNLEKALDTPAKIYYKFEGNNTSGSHKLNSAIAQVYYAKEQGLKALTTETGAGQWGTAMSEACSYFNMPLTVFMVKVSYQQKPYRKAVMQTFGADVIASPSEQTAIGRAILEANPGTGGSLGCAISEAVERAVTTEGTRYVLGSVLNQVLLHQSIIGLESKIAMEQLDEYPDIVIGCNGGGSNFSGIAYPFLKDTFDGKEHAKFIAVEAEACPKLTKGVFTYDYGDSAGMAPITMMYSLGHSFHPSGIHAGGLRYHGDSPLLSQLYHDGFIEAAAVGQKEVFEAALLFAQTEAIVPAPESSHAICQAIKEANKCKESGEEKVILFNLSGNGYFDMTAYDMYLSGKIGDGIPGLDEEIARAQGEIKDLGL